jgi:hypothetical protein
MEKKLINEISRNRQLMGLLNEQVVPKLTREVGEFLTKKFANISDRAILDDIELLSKITSRKVQASDADYINLISRLIKSDKKISDYLVPKIINNLPTGQLNYIAGFKSKIRNAIKNGATYDAVLKGIDVNLTARVNNVPVFNTPFPEVMTYLKNDLEKYAYEIYYPTIARSKKSATEIKKDFSAGFKMGKESKSATLPSLTYMLNTLTRSKITKLIDKLFNTKFAAKLQPDELKAVKDFLWYGVADGPMLKKAYDTLGYAGWAGNLSMQLLKKVWFLMKIKWAINFFIPLLKDLISKGEEITNEELSEFSKVVYRMCKAIELPSFGWVSPAYWFAGLIGTTLLGASGGSRSKAYNRFLTYLKGDDENAVGKWWDGVPIGDLLSSGVVYLDNLIRDIDNDEKEIEKGNSSESKVLTNLGIKQTDTVSTQKLDSIKQQDSIRGSYNWDDEK